MDSLYQQVKTGEAFWEEQIKLYSEYIYLSPEELNSLILLIESQIDDLINKSTLKRFEEATVIAATMDTYISRFQINNDPTDDNAILGEHLPLDLEHVFVDEAGYCSLIKGATILANDCPVTFLGDHMQLPPVCEMNDDEIEKDNRCVLLWSSSALMIEDLFTQSFQALQEKHFSGQAPIFNRIKKSDLTLTHRFSKTLANILNAYVYKNGFNSIKDVDQFNLVILDCRKVPGNKKRENPAEAKIIHDYVSKLLNEDFAILSPYKDQVSLLGQLIPSERERIMTVHGSQGREWDTVIISISDSSEKWFTDSTNKTSRGLMLLNTAISRVKRRLVITCDCNYWGKQKEQLIGNLISQSIE